MNKTKEQRAAEGIFRSFWRLLWGQQMRKEILNNHLVEEELNERCIFCLNEIGRRIPLKL